MGTRIAICDDTPADLAAIRTALDDFLTARGVSAAVKTFPHPDALLSAACAEPFDLYLLDVVMPMVDGLSVVRELRRSQECVPVVYFTTSRDYAIEAFGVHALGYVLKPWSSQQFDETLERAFRSVAREAGRLVSFKTSDGLCRIDVGTIVYVTAAKAANCKTLHLNDGKTVDVRMTFEALADICGASAAQGGVPFFADGRYALVNPYRVRSISGETVTFDNGATLAIHRNSVAALRHTVSDLPW